MRHLVLYREEPSQAAALPPQLLIEAVEATGQWINEIRKSGKATDAGFMSGLHGGFAIFETKSGGELAELVESAPARPFCSVEVIPLMTVEESQPIFGKAKQRIADMLQKLAKMNEPR
jgi:hypothetical protein